MDVPTFGALLADRNRAAMLLELLDGRMLPASELAERAGISRSLASAHLCKLERHGIVAVEARGRHRCYALARPEIAMVLERLSALAPPPPPRGLHAHAERSELSFARSCYDHLAGALAVDVTARLEADGLVLSHETGLELTHEGRTRLSAAGVDVEGAATGRRAFARTCLDWTERRPHIAGALGAAILSRFLEADWLRRRDGTRALALTGAGARALRNEWRLDVDPARVRG